jgi:hypothetical protein
MAEHSIVHPSKKDEESPGDFLRKNHDMLPISPPADHRKIPLDGKQRSAGEDPDTGGWEH